MRGLYLDRMLSKLTDSIRFRVDHAAVEESDKLELVPLEAFIAQQQRSYSSLQSVILASGPPVHLFIRGGTRLPPTQEFPSVEEQAKKPVSELLTRSISHRHEFYCIQDMLTR